MYYIPDIYLNSNYTYYLNNHIITIRTNNNCWYQYQTQYCDCYDTDPTLNYITTNAYSCTTQNYRQLDYNKLSNNIIYRNDFNNILFICLFVMIFTYLIPYKILTRLFRRWA